MVRESFNEDFEVLNPERTLLSFKVGVDGDVILTLITLVMILSSWRNSIM